jgi:hypothetical protein
MPCKDGEEAMNARDKEPPCTPPRPTGNGGADYSESDDQMDSENESDEDLQASKKKRKYHGSREYTLMKRWATGEKAKMDSEDIERGLFELARDWMSQSKFKKLPCHQSKPTHVSLWKQFREYKVRKGSILIRLFRCPLHHRCKCKAGIQITEGPDSMQLERRGEHNPKSHDDGQSKYLKHEQIIAVADAVTVAPQQSATQLRRNLQLAESPTKHIEPLLLRCMQRVVHASRAQLSGNCKVSISIVRLDRLLNSRTSNGSKRLLPTTLTTMIPKMIFISICSAHMLSVAI